MKRAIAIIVCFCLTPGSWLTVPAATLAVGHTNVGGGARVCVDGSGTRIHTASVWLATARHGKTCGAKLFVTFFDANSELAYGPDADGTTAWRFSQT